MTDSNLYLTRKQSWSKYSLGLKPRGTPALFRDAEVATQTLREEIVVLSRSLMFVYNLEYITEHWDVFVPTTCRGALRSAEFVGYGNAEVEASCATVSSMLTLLFKHFAVRIIACAIKIYVSYVIQMRSMKNNADTTE